MKNYLKTLVVLFCLLGSLSGYTQPRLIIQFDKTRCFETPIDYATKHLPGDYKFPISLNGNMELQSWVLWAVKGTSFQRLERGFAKSFVLLKIPAPGVYIIVVDDGINPLLIEIEVSKEQILTTTYSNCATH